MSRAEAILRSIWKISGKSKLTVYWGQKDGYFMGEIMETTAKTNRNPEPCHKSASRNRGNENHSGITATETTTRETAYE